MDIKESKTNEIIELKRKCELLRKKIRQSILFLSEHVCIVEPSHSDADMGNLGLREDIIILDEEDKDEGA